MNSATPTTKHDRYDAIIVGSGAGGSAAAYSLVTAGRKVLLIEKGPRLEKSAATLDINVVVREGVFKSHEIWRDRHGGRLVPEEYFNLGGKTKWYGAALLRYSRAEFDADQEFSCYGWPISYNTLAPHYATAEQRLGAREFACEPDLQRMLDRLQRIAPQWETQPLPLGLKKEILDNVREEHHFDGFASVANLKGDAVTAFLNALRERPNFSLRTENIVTELIGDANDAQTIIGVRLSNGHAIYASAILLAAGALHSPRLLQRYVEARQLQSLPMTHMLGRNLKLHLLTAVIAISPSRKTDALRKTRLLVDAQLPHSSLQPLGFDGELIGTLIPKWIPRWLALALGKRAYGFFLQTEDGAHRDNRVYDSTDGLGNITGTPVLDYNAARTKKSQQEHRQLVRRFLWGLYRIGMLSFARRIGPAGTAHANGTMMMGDDAAHSVVNAEGCVHGMQSLYVVDGSVLPRASRVNPSLSIYAWGLRIGQLLAVQLNAKRED